MCGIAGIMVPCGDEAPAPSELRRMAWSLRHRGPDGYGIYLDDEVGFAHTRLAIIDPCGGDQPLSNEDDTIWITFNGEIFNYIELRAQLESWGHRFKTRSDTEVVVHAYEEWGANAWRRLNGQFAIGLRDTRERCLWLVRDRAGIVPLFYARLARKVVFGSEAKAIFASGRIRPKPDLAALAEVFTLWSAPGPATVFAGVQVVPPGTAIRLDHELRESRQVYSTWRFEAKSASAARSTQDASEQLEHELRQAVKIRLRADVPVGAYLSGGLDSSVIAKLVRQVDTSPLRTFAVRFEDERYDEGKAQERMARELGTTHHEIIATSQLMRDELRHVVQHCETPLLRTGPVPMFVLSSLVRQLGMRVVLTGEGADELLGGYDVFKEDKIRRFWARRPESAVRPLLLGRVHPYVANANGAMWREFFRRGVTEVDSPFYSHRLRWENTAWTLRFLAPEVRAALDAEALEAHVSAALPAGWREASPMERAQHLEIATFMTPYLLSSQGDRALMANGVEGRYPYLDPGVIETCSGLSARQKLCGLREKVTLRALAGRLLPKEIAQRRKWPYRAPIGVALFGADAPEYVRDLLCPEGLDKCPLIDGRSARSLCAKALTAGQRTSEREEMALIGLLTLQLWYQEFIDAGASSRRVPEIKGEALVKVDRRSTKSARPVG